jgi:hypothetical protein
MSIFVAANALSEAFVSTVMKSTVKNTTAVNPSQKTKTATVRILVKQLQMQKQQSSSHP